MQRYVIEGIFYAPGDEAWVETEKGVSDIKISDFFVDNIRQGKEVSIVIDVEE